MSVAEPSLDLSSAASKSVFRLNLPNVSILNRNIIFGAIDLKMFNKQFDEVHQRDERGYGTWLSSSNDTDSVDDSSDNDSRNVETNIVDPDFNKKFEEKVVSGSHINTDYMGLHPEQMANLSGVTLGVNINDDRPPSEVFTSMMNEHPEFTDVYSAFTHDNTVIDKVAAFDESTRPRTLEELIAEREATVDSSTLSETIVAHERKKLEEDIERDRLLREHFDTTGIERKWLTNNSFLHDFSAAKPVAENTVVNG